MATVSALCPLTTSPFKAAEITPKMATLLISDVFDLPWSDRSLLGEVVKRIEKDLVDDEEARLDLEKNGTSFDFKADVPQCRVVC